MSVELEILRLARGYVAQSWCKELARYKNQVWQPQGEFIPVDPKAKEIVYKFVDATAWSLTGALLRAEVEHEGMIGQKAHHPLFTTQTYKFVAAAVKERGFSYMADFNDPDRSRGPHTQQDMLNVMDRAIELCQSQCLF